MNKGDVSRNLTNFKQWQLPPNWVKHKNNQSKHDKKVLTLLKLMI